MESDSVGSGRKAVGVVGFEVWKFGVMGCVCMET